MRNNKKGITVTSITVYLILFFMFTTVTTIISSRFNEDLFNDRGTAINITAINKLECNLLKSASDSYTVTGKLQANKTTLTFSNSDVYVFDGEKNIIYKNGGKLVDFVKEYEMKLTDNIIDINVTLSKYTNEVARNIKISCPVKTEYVSDGLIAHFDGINNVGNRTHDSKSSIWRDLSENAAVGNLSTSFKHDGVTSGWVENGLLFSKENATLDAVRASYATNVYSSMTVELTIRTMDQLGEASTDYIKPLYLFPSGSTYTLYLGTRQRVRLMYGSGNNTVYNDGANEKYYMDKDKCCTLTFVQNDLTKRTYYFNGEKRTEKTGLALSSIELTRLIMYGHEKASYIIHSVRVYDRGLTDEEIEDNFYVDRLRFGK